MGNKLVMGYWDCQYCETKGIKGTEDTCPNCGKIRADGTKFYMKNGEVQYLNEEEASRKGKGADWKCSYCGAYNSILNNNCIGCGASKQEADGNYFEVRKREKERERSLREKPSENSSSGNKSSNRQHLHKHNLMGMVLATLFVIAIIVATILGEMPKTIQGNVESFSWKTVINIEKYKEVEESDWHLPSDAKLDHKQKEIYTYEQVFAGYVDETYQEYEQIGSHMETTYEDNGDGTFSEKTVTVPDYGYVTKTKQVAKYDQVPVYKTKYYYWIWKWEHDREVTNTGNGKKPKYSDVKYGKKEREENRYTEYYVSVLNKDNKVSKYKCSAEIFKLLEEGQDVKLKVSDNEIQEIVD